MADGNLRRNSRADARSSVLRRQSRGDISAMNNHLHDHNRKSEFAGAKRDARSLSSSESSTHSSKIDSEDEKLKALSPRSKAKEIERRQRLSKFEDNFTKDIYTNQKYIDKADHSDLKNLNKDINDRVKRLSQNLHYSSNYKEAVQPVIKNKNNSKFRDKGQDDETEEQRRMRRKRE